MDLGASQKGDDESLGASHKGDDELVFAPTRKVTTN